MDGLRWSRSYPLQGRVMQWPAFINLFSGTDALPTLANSICSCERQRRVLCPTAVLFFLKIFFSSVRIKQTRVEKSRQALANSNGCLAHTYLSMADKRSAAGLVRGRRRRGDKLTKHLGSRDHGRTGCRTDRDAGLNSCVARRPRGVFPSSDHGPFLLLFLFLTVLVDGG